MCFVDAEELKMALDSDATKIEDGNNKSDKTENNDIEVSEDVDAKVKGEDSKETTIVEKTDPIKDENEGSNDLLNNKNNKNKNKFNNSLGNINNNKKKNPFRKMTKFEKQKMQQQQLKQQLALSSLKSKPKKNENENKEEPANDPQSSTTTTNDVEESVPLVTDANDANAEGLWFLLWHPPQKTQDVFSTSL